MNKFDSVDNRQYMSKYLNDTLILGGLFKSEKYGVMGMFSITNSKKLGDFIPVAAYGKKIEIPRTKPDLYKKYPYGIFQGWLVLERAGTYYVSHLNLKGLNSHYYNYDLIRDLKRWDEYAYPSEVYDFIKDIVFNKTQNVSFIDYLRGKKKK